MKRAFLVGVLCFVGSVTACGPAPISAPLPDLRAQNAQLLVTANAMSTQFALVNAQSTAVAAQLTATPAALTQSWQATRDVLAMEQTQAALAQQKAEATATAAMAQTQDALALAVRLAQLTGTAQAIATGTAQAQTIATEARAVQFTATANAMTTAQAHAQREAQTAAFWQWLPVGLMVLAVFVALRLVRVFETRQRVIAQTHGGPLIVLEQRHSLAHFLPRWLHALVWLVERQTVVMDPDRSLHPVTFIAPETAAQPLLAEPGAQERTTARDQAAQLVAALPPGRERSGSRLAQTLLPNPLAPGPPGNGDVCDVQVVAPDAVQPWLDELRQKLLIEGDSDDTHPTGFETRPTR